MTIVKVSIDESHFLAPFVHEADKVVGIAFVGVAQELVIPSLFIGVYFLIPCFYVMKQANHLAYRHRSIVSTR